MDGVAFKKTFSYAGFEMQPKSYDVRSGSGAASQADAGQPTLLPAQHVPPCRGAEPTARAREPACGAPDPGPGGHAPPLPEQNPKILLLNIELELKSEKENAEVRLDDPAKYQSIVDAGEEGGGGALPRVVGVCGSARRGGRLRRAWCCLVGWVCA